MGSRAGYDQDLVPQLFQADSVSFGPPEGHANWGGLNREIRIKAVRHDENEWSILYRRAVAIGPSIFLLDAPPATFSIREFGKDRRCPRCRENLFSKSPKAIAT